MIWGWVRKLWPLILGAMGIAALVLTGRRVPPELYEYADYITEMREIKHPYQQGIQARRGIEY